MSTRRRADHLIVVAAWALVPGPGVAAEAGAALHRPGDQVLLTLHGVGAQVYACKASAEGPAAWTFQAPRADLLAEGVSVGQHAAGPSWTYRDGSRITAKVEARADAPSPADIPWLRLAVTGHEGEGTFNRVTGVIRANTRGGVLAGPCAQPGALRDVPYEADYSFIAGE